MTGCSILTGAYVCSLLCSSITHTLILAALMSASPPTRMAVSTVPAAHMQGHSLTCRPCRGSAEVLQRTTIHAVSGLISLTLWHNCNCQRSITVICKPVVVVITQLVLVVPVAAGICAASLAGIGRLTRFRCPDQLPLWKSSFERAESPL